MSPTRVLAMAWNRPEFTPPAETSSTSFFGSMPARAPTAKASAVAVQIAWAMKLLSSLTMWPAPGPPTWNTFSAKVRNTGSIRAKVASSAPTMTFSLPNSASTGVRASGASTSSTPAPAQAARNCVVESGSLVEQSTMTNPFLPFAPASRPPVPVIAASTCGDPVTQRNTISHDVASADGVATSVAPAATRSAIRARLRCTVKLSAWPFASRFFAMPWPIKPDAPMNPMLAIASPLIAETMIVPALHRRKSRPEVGKNMVQRSSTTAFAKSTRPEIGGVVRRELLFARLDGMPARTVAWISAPPGFGKTTLAASYLEARSYRWAWYQVDPDDDDGETFFHYVAHAVRKLGVEGDGVPAFGPEHRDDLAGFSRRFFRALFSSGVGLTALVLDNLHELSSESPLRTILEAGLPREPRGR